MDRARTAFDACCEACVRAGRTTSQSAAHHAEEALDAARMARMYAKRSARESLVCGLSTSVTVVVVVLWIIFG